VSYVIVPEICEPGFATPNVLVIGAVKVIVTISATAGEAQVRIATSAIMPSFKERGFIVIPKVKFDAASCGWRQKLTSAITHEAKASEAE
jgi:hypothetical protein